MAADATRDITYVFGVPVDNLALGEAAERTRQLVEESGKSCKLVAHVNTEVVTTAQSNPDFFDILNTSALSTPDSRGVVLAGKRQGKPFKERIPGPAYYRAVCAMAAREGYTIYLLGGRGDTAQRAKAAAEQREPGVQIVGARDGYFEEMPEKDVIAEINDLAPNILFVCMGAPAQERWIHEHKNVLNVDVAVGEGGTIDYEAGNTKRAPQWMQNAGIEWLWRLVQQPSRIGRMMALPKFWLKLQFSKDVANRL